MPNLVELIKKAAMDAFNNSMPTSVFYGTVVGTSPRKINVEQKLTIDVACLIPTETVVKAGLTEGDKVILIRAQGGQKYVVLDKVGDIT